MTANNSSDGLLYRRILLLARPYWPHIGGLFLLSLLSTPLALVGPLPLKMAVDSVIGSDPLPPFVSAVLPEAATASRNSILLTTIVLVLGLALLHQISSMASNLARMYIGEKLVLEFRARVFGHGQRLSLAYHDSRGTADAIYRIQYDTSSVQYIAIDGVIPFVAAGLTLVSMLYVSFRIDWQLSLVALTVSPFLFLLARVSRSGLRAHYKSAKRLQSAAYSIVQEVLGALRVVKAFGREDHEEARFVRTSAESLQARLRVTFLEGALALMLGLTTAVGTAAVLFIGVRHVQSGVLTLGSLLLIMGYLSQLYSPLSTISRKIASMQSYLASAERAFALLDEVPDVVERPGALPLAAARGAISLQDVCFSYGDTEVLRDVSFDVIPGKRVGIAGRTGAGKTTLVSLLTRFYDPKSGRILLDGTDLRDYKVADLRSQFAIVLQEPVLFSTSIAENIAYARPGASDEEISRAAEAANIHGFIRSLPDGYRTSVGERGMRLSGGERQRIALARAFLKDAPILIMDEPTSSVDMQTEAEIVEAMERLMAGRTTFMIAHRLTTLRDCDLLLVLEAGRLVERRTDVSATIDEAMALGRLVPGLDEREQIG